MDSTRTSAQHRRRWAVVAAGAVAIFTATLAAGASPASAGTDTTVPPDDTTPPGDSTTTAATTPSTEEPTTSSAGATTTAAAAATTTAAATGASSAEFAATLEEQCGGDTGQQLLASGLQVVMGTDGSLRIVEIALACDIEFVGAVDEALGRPTTNIEALIADSTNNVTPNQAQTDLLNEELAIYWRIANAWAIAQGATAPDDATPTTAVTDSSVPDETTATTG